MASETAAPRPPSTETLQRKADLAIWLTLATWPALTLAVQNGWGGPDSAAKRDWFAGALSDACAATPDADVAYVEEMLLQVMQDEFEVVVDDDSPADIAAQLLARRARVLRGDVTEVDELLARWQARQGSGGPRVTAQYMSQGNEEEDDDDDEDEEEWDPKWDGDDVEMQDSPAPPAAPRPQRREPEVDPDGFTVVRRR